MEFQNSQYTIDKILNRVRTSKLALPDFQRDFVWSPGRVAELLDSISRQWPIGALLLLEGPQQFASRSINCGPFIEKNSEPSFILDGQQRITALYHAVYDVSDYCYYVDFKILNQEKEEYIRWERRDKFTKLYPSTKERALAQIALISDLWELQDFYSWISYVEDENEKIKLVQARDTRLSGLQSKVYKVMAIELEQGIDLEALSRIFETLNRTGVRLNAFDLMVASLYPSGFHLRDEWENALSYYEIIRKISPDALEILKLTSLVVRETVGRKYSKGVRQGDILSIDRSLIINNWPTSLELYAKALEYCRNNFGITTGNLVPYWSMILGVAAWLLKGEEDDRLISQWWTSRLSTLYFSQAANTRIVSDFEEICNGTIRTNIQDENLREILLEPAKRHSSLMKGIAGLLIRNGATDILTEEPLTSTEEISFMAYEDGKIRKLTQQDGLARLFILSKTSFDKIRKGLDIDKNNHAHMDSLKRQNAKNDYAERANFIIDLLQS
ncbi:DUF262 domain-containing protein [Billgrantia antri]|uniref:DUF262 domain-containing protein n=1 Tax=Halomonas sulfidivorans TaxID=2733488 RepID=A0ABX7WIR2_9GAMM|nr:DUF262 domain-containing protein [Halomonas sulfidivorans]QTP60323.1 DUF262 domain-containing protein [Halomonas sulfidivorans]